MSKKNKIRVYNVAGMLAAAYSLGQSSGLLMIDADEVKKIASAYSKKNWKKWKHPARKAIGL